MSGHKNFDELARELKADPESRARIEEHYRRIRQQVLDEMVREAEEMGLYDEEFMEGQLEDPPDAEHSET